ncbi:S-layer homology domain-containing protein [Bacillus shivajii]|uniref:glycosyl hydrolase family 18 protein n=1 Tax=Bacillus shivajii TaxID=1983719 RepID=UPI001CFC271B|nr:glycosyl hydrolase family 18 protein [Bacillus shivajii]UCZ55317.1 S-layer homology domain-containing protein [Bacillus shivajii]
MDYSTDYHMMEIIIYLKSFIRKFNYKEGEFMRTLSFVMISLITLILFTIPIFKHSNAQEDELFNMTYVYFGGPNTYIQQVDATQESLHVVSPNYFDVSPEGNLDVTWMLRTSFISEMHKRGIKVVPFLANHWDIQAGINGLKNREKLARDIASAIEQYNLDGVNVDIEGVGHQYRDEHNDFIRLLREYIPNEKELSVAIAANPNGWNTGWHGIYDEKELAEYCDYLMIMAYDESWGGPDSPIGPVASLNFQERSIQYVLNEGVSSDQIVLGLPFYGRMWKTDGPTIDGDEILGMGLAHRRVPDFVSKYNGNINYDVDRKSASVYFTIPSGEEEFQGGRRLTAGEYVIWFDNEEAKKEKLRLPQQYDIKGTGSWALSLEKEKTWEYYTSWLNGHFLRDNPFEENDEPEDDVDDPDEGTEDTADLTFNDVPSGYWGEKSIFNVARRGWMAGTAPAQFSPESDLTRAQGAVILVRALGYANATPTNYVFRDTHNHWAKKDIEIAHELGMVNGIGDNRYGPDDPLTREQLAAILQNIFEFPYETVDRNPFPDIRKGDWSYESVLAIYQNGYLSGFQDGTFRPRTKSNRAQMAALMDRMSGEFDAINN